MPASSGRSQRHAPVYSCKVYVWSRVQRRLEQDGATVRCWNCGRDVPIHVPHTEALVSAFTSSVRRAFRVDVILWVLAGAALLMASLCIPYVGPYLAFAILAAGAWCYQEPAVAGNEWKNNLTRSVGRISAIQSNHPADCHPSSVWHASEAAVLVTPVLIRNGGYIKAYAGGSHGGMVAAVGWFVFPRFSSWAPRGEPVEHSPEWPRGLARHPIATFLCARLVSGRTLRHRALTRRHPDGTGRIHEFVMRCPSPSQTGIPTR